MAKILHIPTGIIFFCPDLYYFRRLFDTDTPPTEFRNYTSNKNIQCMMRLIDLMEEGGDLFVKDGYPGAVIELREMGKVCFEVIDES